MLRNAATGQINCQGCNVTLAYPIGVPSVRCPMCTTVTNVQQFQVRCVCCQSILVLPINTTLAMCPRCRTVMSIPPSIAQQHGAAGASGPPKECVYIERPPTKDASGKRVKSLSVGTKIDDDRVQ